MTRRLRRLLASLFIVLCLFAAMSLHPAGQADATEATQFRLEATDSGFRYNGSSGAITIEVEQGQEVALTFVWNHTAYPSEEHIFVLDGYKVETDRLDYYNREGTLRFVATKPGTFIFKCDLDCDVHDALQRGYLKVRPTGSSGAANLTPTELRVTPSSSTTAGEVVSLMATLRDAKGAPVPKAEVRFYVDAQFAGTSGPMEIGTATTDANGVAFLEYQPSLAMAEHKVTLAFEGQGVFAHSETAVVIRQSAMPAPAYRVESSGLEFLREWAPVVLVLILLAIWAIYTVVLSQLLAIRRNGSRE